MFSIGFVFVVIFIAVAVYGISNTRNSLNEIGGSKVERYSILQILYSIFLGILIAVFIGVGINTFYSAPPAPKWPTELNYYGKEPSEAQIRIEKAYAEKQRAYDEKMKPYNRNVSIIALIGAVSLVGVSLVFEKKLRVISDGLMAGGILTLMYGLGRGFASGDDKYSFVTISVALVLVLYLGFHRFVNPDWDKKEPSATSQSN